MNAQRPSKRWAERSPGLTLPRKKTGQPAAPPVERTTPVYRGRRYETGSSRKTCVQASSSSTPPQGRAKAVEPSEPIPFGGRSRPPRLQSSARYVLGPDPRPGHSDAGGGPAQGAPYPFGSWICYFCEQVNGPASEDCLTFDPDGQVCPGHRGSSRGSPPIDPATIPVDADVAARRDQRRADKVAFRKEQAMAVSELARSSWRCFYTHTCGEWNLSFRNKCWKCSSTKGQAVEVVLGVPDPVADERSESEGSKNDHEEQTADRIAEKPGSSASHSSSGAGTRSAEAEVGTEKIPSQRRLPSAAAVEAAVQAPEAQQDSLQVSSLCRWCHGAAVLCIGRPPL